MPELKNKDEQYNELLTYKKPVKKKKLGLNILFRGIFVTFFVVAITFLAMQIVVNYDDISTILGSFVDRKLFGVNIASTPDLTPSKFNFKMLNRYQNILLLGVDSNGPNTLPFSGVRSDTIIILNIDNHNKSVNAISIPRDSKVYISNGHGVQKINAAYAIGGIELTKKTIEETLGIKIHNYIIINSEGIKKLIDTIGGVPIYVDNNMSYDDYSARLHIHLKRGEHILNGEEAEGYLRFRKDSMGDIGRVQRQQKFLSAFVEKIKSPESWKKTPEALKIANLYSRTDLNLYQMSQYVSTVKDLDLNKVEFVTLPGTPNKKGIISYWILNPEKTQETINRLIYRQNPNITKENVSVGIMYSRRKEFEALSIKDELTTAGYDVNCIGKSALVDKSQIIRYNTSVRSDLIKEMKRKVSGIAGFKYVHESVRTYCDSSDVVITIKD